MLPPNSTQSVFGGVQSSGGSGAASGMLTSLSAASPYIAIAGAFYGGITGGLAANKTNKMIKNNVKELYKSIDKNINNTRLAYADASSIASTRATDELSQLSLALSGFGSSGLSATEAYSQVAADKSASQDIRNIQLQQEIDNYQISKKNTYEDAKSQMVNPFMGVITGAAQGFGAAAAAGTTLKNTVDQIRINDAMTTFNKDWNENGATDINLARASALHAGIPAYNLINPKDNPFLTPFMTSIKENRIQNEYLKSSVLNAQNNYDLFKFNDQTPLYNYQEMLKSNFLMPAGKKPSQSASQRIMDLMSK